MLVENSTDEHIYEVLLKRIEVFEKGLGSTPAILIEKPERAWSIDASEVIRAHSEQDLRNRILNSEILIGLDDVFDEEIRTAHQETQRSAISLRWTAFERLMFLLLGEKRAEKVTITRDSLIFEDIAPSDLAALIEIVPVKDREATYEELLYNYTPEGTLTVTFNKDAS